MDHTSRMDRSTMWSNSSLKDCCSTLQWRRSQRLSRLPTFFSRWGKDSDCRCWKVPSFQQSNECLLELIITTCRDLDFQKNLLSKGPGFSLEKALRLGKTYKATASHIQQLNDIKSPTSIQAIRANTCKNCGGTHTLRKCPAYKPKCHSCGKDNHWL